MPAQASPTFFSSAPDLPPDEAPNLWLAAWHGDLATIHRLIDAGAAIDQPGPKGSPPLIYALRRRQFEAAQLLLARGANPSQTGESGFSALSHAFWAGLDREYKPDAYDGRWLRLLLDKGADLHAASRFREPLIHLVATYYPPQPDALRLVLGYHPRIDQRAGQDCRTALLSVVSQESKYPGDKNAIVRLLLAAGAHPGVSAYGPDGLPRSNPLLAAAQAYAYDDIDRRHQDDHRPSAHAARLEIIDLLLAFGADPRLDGEASPPPEACREQITDAHPPLPEPAVTGNKNLTRLLGATVNYRQPFERILEAAAPVFPGEIGYGALAQALREYAKVTERIETIAAGRYPAPDDAQRLPLLQTRRADLEYALRRLLALGVAVNPDHAILPHGADDWRELWIARHDLALSGEEFLPLYQERLPDDLYATFLQAGASPAIRPGDHFSNGQSLVFRLIERDAASKLRLLQAHPGLLARIPPWCERTVADIDRALGDSDDKARQKLATPTGQAAKSLLLALLRQNACQAAAQGKSRAGFARLTRLGDPAIDAALRENAAGSGKATD